MGCKYKSSYDGIIVTLGHDSIIPGTNPPLCCHAGTPAKNKTKLGDAQKV